MNITQFRALTEKEKVEYVNKKLLSGVERKDLGAEFGVKAGTVTKDLNDLGYKMIKGLYVKEEVEEVVSNKSGSLAGIEELLKVKDELLALVNTNNQTLNIDFNNLYTKGEAINKTFKTYDGVIKDFETLCKEDYPMYKVQDLLGFALMDFVNKYKK